MYTILLRKVWLKRRIWFLFSFMCFAFRFRTVWKSNRISIQSALNLGSQWGLWEFFSIYFSDYFSAIDIILKISDLSYHLINASFLCHQLIFINDQCNQYCGQCKNVNGNGNATKLVKLFTREAGFWWFPFWKPNNMSTLKRLKESPKSHLWTGLYSCQDVENLTAKLSVN